MNYSLDKKRPTIFQNRESMTNSNNRKTFMSARRSVAAMMMMVLSMLAFDAQAQCGQSALVCNNLVRVSLDTSCTALITPDVVLKGLNIDTSLYDVEVYDPAGELIPGALITDDYDGQRLEVRIYCSGTNLFCWGSIIVEDKIPPTIEVTPCDTTLSCIVMPFELDPNSLVTSVSFTDEGCTKPDTFSITDFEESVFPCRDTVKIIRRVFSTFDGAGNQASKTQTIYLLRGQLNEITYPQDTIIDCLDEADISADKLGMPDVGSCDHFEISMSDAEIITCGVARKILRRWRITDICSNRDTIATQVIKIEDNSAPKFTFDNFDIPLDRVVTDKFNCTSSVIGINNPQVTDCNLAQTILTTFYQLTDENGVPQGQLFPAAVNDMLSDPADPMTATMVWDLNDVPVGADFRVIFVADDQCGNIARDTSAIFSLPDTSPPNAVCEGNTTVVLNNDGVTEVRAQTFDDNSFDNCGIVRREVRRFDSSCPGNEADLQFGESIHFCCDDIANNPIKVVFRVYDGSDGFSDCIVSVFVQDKRPINLTCADDLNFNCGTDSTFIINTIRTSAPTVDFVCGEQSLEADIPSWTESECGGANFTVTWTAIDLNGQMATCTQNVNIGNLVDATVVRPNLNITLASCGAGTEPADIPGSEPTVVDVDCENILTTWEDVIGEGTGSSCVVITRTWAIIDWCKFDGGNIEAAIIDGFDQIITISDNQQPEISNCSINDLLFLDADGSCDEQITLSVSATDDCTPTEDLSFGYEIDYNADGTVDRSGEGGTLTDRLPVGSHSITWTVGDVCGNTVMCTYGFTIETRSAPNAICIGLTEAVIAADGTATVLASSLDVSSTLGCDQGSEGLIFAFNEGGDQTEMVYRCSDISNGIVGSTPVDLYVIDPNGGFAVCEVIITISDRQNNVCMDNSVASVVSGFITDEEMSAVGEVPVTATRMSTGEVFSSMTDESGFYAFSNLEGADDYEINPVLDGYPLAGITTLDLVIIQQHILGITQLTSPYKLLAADVNNSNSITALDLVALRQLILGIKDDIPNDNWKFVDGAFEFDPTNNWFFDDNIMVENASAIEDENNFIGLKVGDVNGNAFGALASLAGGRSTSLLDVRAERTGDVVRYNFSAASMAEVIGFQLGIQLAADMEIVSLGSNRIDIDNNHFNIKDGDLRMSWSSSEAINPGDETIFFVDIKVTGSDIPALALSNTGITSEIYEGSLEGYDIQLRNVVDEVEVAEMSLLQNVPNPFTTETKISFYLPVSGSVEFAITDLNGKNVYRSTNLYNKGINTLNIQSSDLGQSGIYYYTVTTATSKETKRMIVLH